MGDFGAETDNGAWDIAHVGRDLVLCAELIGIDTVGDQVAMLYAEGGLVECQVGL
jgi:hypothetical protein